MCSGLCDPAVKNLPQQRALQAGDLTQAVRKVATRCVRGENATIIALHDASFISSGVIGLRGVVEEGSVASVAILSAFACPPDTRVMCRISVLPFNDEGLVILPSGVQDGAARCLVVRFLVILCPWKSTKEPVLCLAPTRLAIHACRSKPTTILKLMML